MIIGQDLLLEPKLDICLSDCEIKGNEGSYERCAVSMKYPSDLRNDAISRFGQLQEIKYVLASTQRTRRILDAQYQISNFKKVVSNSKLLNNDKRSMLRDVLTKY